MVRSSTRNAALAAGLAALTAWVAFAQTPPPSPATPTSPTTAAPAVATVGPLRIARDEFEARTRQASEQYRARAGADLPAEVVPIVRRQMLESLVRRDLLLLEAQRLGIRGTDQEAEAVLKSDPYFNPAGKFDEAKFVAIRTTNPGAFGAALAQSRVTIGARKLNDRIEKQFLPDEATLRARATRQLNRASFEYLLLPRTGFSGAYAEPRESEVLAAYRAGAPEFRRPERATLGIVMVDQPPLADSIGIGTRAGVAWMERMKARADSLLAAAQKGASLEQLAAPYGGVRQVTALPGNFPGYWQGDERTDRAVFTHPGGTLLAEPVPAPRGWIVARVDSVQAAHVAPLAEVAKDLRARLRADRRQHHDERELRARYDARRDSLRAPGYKVRYAVFDTATIQTGEPSAADLDRFYRGHLADYSSYDAKTGGIASRPLAEVRDEVRRRWLRDRRATLARESAERVAEAWSHGRRDAMAERSAARVRDVGPVPLGATADSGTAGRVVGDSLAARKGALGVGIAVVPGGSTAVFHVYERVPSFIPSFDQARATLETERAAVKAREDEAGAHRMFDTDPVSFATGNVVHYSSLTIPAPDMFSVPLTHAEVERWHREHLDRYSAPEVVRASHILFAPKDKTPAADRAARARAEKVLERVRAGEDFATLAKQNSDDEATRDQGGELGEFGRGAMLQEFERVAFSMRAGDVSDLVKTEVGYHIIKCHAYTPAFAQPLTLIYGTVSSELALAKADTLASHRADSLARVVHTPAQARAAATRLGLSVLPGTHAIGPFVGPPDQREWFELLEKTRPGQLVSGVRSDKRSGYSISWVDSLSPPQAPDWEQARLRAIDRFRRGAAQRAIDAKTAELDSMMAAGWSLDSVAVLWGGLEHVLQVTSGATLPALGRQPLIDSLAFGGTRGKPLEVGVASPWLALMPGPLRLRVTERLDPNAGQLAARLESERRAELEAKLAGYFETLKKRYPVRILDPRLKDVALPPPRSASMP